MGYLVFQCVMECTHQSYQWFIFEVRSRAASVGSHMEVIYHCRQRRTIDSSGRTVSESCAPFSVPHADLSQANGGASTRSFVHHPDLSNAPLVDIRTVVAGRVCVLHSICVGMVYMCVQRFICVSTKKK